MANAEVPVTPAPAVMQIFWDPWLNLKFATVVHSQMPQRTTREDVAYSPYDGRAIFVSDNVEQPVITTSVAPTAPATLTATAGSGQVALTWSESPGAQSYQIFRGTASEGEGESPYALSVGTTFTDTTVAVGTTYFYTVQAVNPAGNSGSSPEASAAPNAFAAAPSAPASPSATAGSGQITVAWTAAAGATSYSIFSGSTSSGEGATPHASTAGTSFIDAVTTGTKVYYTVAALNAAGISAASAEVSATAG